jgi:hypothetical protein
MKPNGCISAEYTNKLNKRREDSSVCAYRGQGRKYKLKILPKAFSSQQKSVYEQAN